METNCTNCGATLQGQFCSFCGTKHEIEKTEVDEALEKRKKELIEIGRHKERPCKICKGKTLQERNQKVVGGFWKQFADSADYYIVWACEECDNREEVQISAQEHHKITMQEVDINMKEIRKWSS